jgi:hypothetical protein
MAPIPRPRRAGETGETDGEAPITLPAGARITLAASIVSPAVLAFVLLRIVHLTDAVGRALRGDTMIGSGVLTVIVLVLGGVLVAKSMQGTRERTLFVASGAAILFGIVMIITTFTAGEPPEPGEGTPIGIAPWVAPFAPLAAAIWALLKARAVWTSKYDGRDRILYAVLASVMLLAALELGPLGAARSAPRAPVAPAATSGSPAAAP